MNAVLDLFNRISIGWWNYVVLTCWQAAVVGFCVLLLVHVLGRRWPAPLRYAFLVLALLKFACPPLLPMPTGLFTYFTPPRVMLPLVQERKPAQVSGPQTREVVPFHRDFLDRAPLQAVGHMLSLVHWTGWWMLVHGLGTCAVLWAVTRQAASVRALASGSSRLFGGPLGEQYRDLALQLGLARIPRLAVSGEVEGPISFGVKEPAIMLPSRILHHLRPEEIKTVLAHELAHCQRGDLWLNWVQLLLMAAWWFHPVLWLLNRSLREVREDCCDDLLLARGVVSNDAYCDVLLRAAAQLCPPSRLSATLALRGTFHPLGRRLARITDWSLRRADSVSASGTFLVLVLAALFLPGARNQSAAESQPPALQPELVDSALETRIEPVSRVTSTLIARPASAPAIKANRATSTHGIGRAPAFLSLDRTEGQAEAFPVERAAGVFRSPTLARVSVAAPALPDAPRSLIPEIPPYLDGRSFASTYPLAVGISLGRMDGSGQPRVCVFLSVQPSVRVVVPWRSTMSRPNAHFASLPAARLDSGSMRPGPARPGRAL